MADFSKIRRKQTSWPGFFSSTTPVRALPNAHLDEDAEVYQRVKHLQHLRAVQDALDETDVRNTRSGYNPQLDDLFGDPLADRSRFTDVFGRELGLGQTLDELRDEYGPGHVPGEHNEDPDDPRGSSRTGMASEDSDEVTRAIKEWSDSMDRLHEAIKQLRAAEAAVLRLLEAAREMGLEPHPAGIQVLKDAISEYQRAEQEADERHLRALALSKEDWAKKKGRKRQEKPHPDGGSGGRPTGRDWLDVGRAVRELQHWGNPATDFKLGRGVRGPLTAEVLEALKAFQNGGNPAVFDRLGNLEKQRRRMTAQQARRMLFHIRINHPAINWGEVGPPPPSPGRQVPSNSYTFPSQTSAITRQYVHDEDDQ